MVSVFVLAAIAAIAVPPSQGPASADADRGAIRQAALDYAEGYFEGSGERMARAVSPLLSKRGLMVRPGIPPFLVQMNAETLIEAARQGGGKLPADARHLTVDVLSVDGEVASARVFTSQFDDYLHLVKRDGRWQLLNVLWHPPLGPGAPADRAAVERAIRDYAAALAAGDADRARAVVHPDANLRTFTPAPQGRPRVIREQNIETLAAGLASGQLKTPGAADAQVAVYDVDGNIASGAMTIGGTITYLHLANHAGVWRIVNGLACPPAPSTTSR
jgi:putative lumazine-binding protein